MASGLFADTAIAGWSTPDLLCDLPSELAVVASWLRDQVVVVVMMTVGQEEQR
jgi:hypothetical protein